MLRSTVKEKRHNCTRQHAATKCADKQWPSAILKVTLLSQITSDTRASVLIKAMWAIFIAAVKNKQRVRSTGKTILRFLMTINICWVVTVNSNSDLFLEDCGIFLLTVTVSLQLVCFWGEVLVRLRLRRLGLFQIQLGERHKVHEMTIGVLYLCLLYKRRVVPIGPLTLHGCVN
jgi:hypothetical protein